MKIYQAFAHTLTHYSIKATELCDAAARRGDKLAENTVSGFKNGEIKVQLDTLEKILQSLEDVNPEAKKYFAMVLATGNVNSNFFNRPKNSNRTLVPA